MTLQDARDWVQKYENIIGRPYDETEISSLVIVPINGENMLDIFNRADDGDSYEDLLIGHRKFTVMAILDTEYDGYLFYAQREDIEQKLGLV